MVMIDNGWGASLNLALVKDGLNVKMNKMKFYGETEARDCLVQNICEIDENLSGNRDVCPSKSALMSSHF